VIVDHFMAFRNQELISDCFEESYVENYVPIYTVGGNDNPAPIPTQTP
jgi:hypothetical protein